MEGIGLLETNSTENQFQHALPGLQRTIVAEPIGELDEETRLAFLVFPVVIECHT